MNTADHVDRLAARVPDRPAIVDDASALTWADVGVRSRRLAAGLVALGLERGAIVYTQLPSSVELFLVRLACERAGLRVLTVPPAFREAEIGPILEATRPAVAVIADRYRGVDVRALLASIPAAAALRHVIGARRWMRADESAAACASARAGAIVLDDVIARASDVPSGRAWRAGDPCQLGTTSGSTGAPKLVDVRIGARLRTGRVQLDRYGIRADDVVVALTPLITGTADALGYHGCSQSGATLVLVDHFDAASACRVVADRRATVVIGVPTMAARLLAAPELDAVSRGQVRLFVSHGAVLAPSVGAALEDRLGCRVMQAYGTFDYGGVCATSFDDPDDVRLGSVGRPLDGNELRVLDDAGRPCPAGVPGRLYVRGEHANAGYFGRPDVTRAAWATGYFDLAEIGVLDEHGHVRLAGRARELIIRGGQNIVPADIEDLVARHPDVAEVAVIGVPDGDLGEIVCACVVPRAGAALDGAALVAFVRRLGVAAYKLPERVEIFDALPVLGTGHKIDKRRLRELIAAAR